MGKLWKEYPQTTIENIPCICYDWPRDRIIAITTQEGETCCAANVLVPSFTLSQFEKDEASIDFQIRKVVAKAKENYDKDGIDFSSIDPHLYVFKIEGFDDEYGICLTEGPACPTEDFFTDHRERCRKDRESRSSVKLSAS